MHLFAQSGSFALDTVTSITLLCLAQRLRSSAGMALRSAFHHSSGGLYATFTPNCSLTSCKIPHDQSTSATVAYCRPAVHNSTRCELGCQALLPEVSRRLSCKIEPLYQLSRCSAPQYCNAVAQSHCVPGVQVTGCLGWVPVVCKTVVSVGQSLGPASKRDPVAGKAPSCRITHTA